MTDRIDYIDVDGYLIPNLPLSDDDPTTPKEAFLEELTRPPMPEPVLGRYGAMRRSFLENHDPIGTTEMKISGEWDRHLEEIDRTAKERVELAMKQLLKDNPPPDKATDQMGWVQHMNALRAQAEEPVMRELIYSFGKIEFELPELFPEMSNN